MPSYFPTSKAFMGILSRCLVFAASTYQGYGKVIRRLARSIDKCPKELAAQDILSYLHSHLQRGVSRHTVNTWLLTIRSFLGWAAQQGLVAPQLRQQLPSSISYELSQPVAATEQEVDLILSQGRLPAPYQLAVLLMFDMGLRVSEAAQLRWRDVDLATRTINVLGKGSKRRQLPITSLRLYQMLAAASQGVIWPHWPVVWIGHGGKRCEEPLTPTAIRDRVGAQLIWLVLSGRVQAHLGARPGQSEGGADLPVGCSGLFQLRPQRLILRRCVGQLALEFLQPLPGRGVVALGLLEACLELLAFAFGQLHSLGELFDRLAQRGHKLLLLGELCFLRFADLR